MCGIVGCFHPGARGDELLAAVAGMGATIVHRGPDAADRWADHTAGIAVGFQRLAVVDTTPTGMQPMRSPSLPEMQDLEGPPASPRKRISIATWGGSGGTSRSDGGSGLTPAMRNPKTPCTTSRNVGWCWCRTRGCRRSQGDGSAGVICADGTTTLASSSRPSPYRRVSGSAAAIIACAICETKSRFGSQSGRRVSAACKARCTTGSVLCIDRSTSACIRRCDSRRCGYASIASMTACGSSQSQRRSTFARRSWRCESRPSSALRSGR